MTEGKASTQVRGRWWWGVIPVIIMLVVVGLYGKLRPAASQDLVGAVADPPQPAPDFTLVDQLGRNQTLSRFRGRPVALTFIYTHCTDVCPLIAANMHLAYQKLGDQAQNVALVAVTVDPERDTVQQIRDFSDQRHLTDEWYFLTGSRAQVQPVWSKYGIYTQPVNAEGTPVAPSSDSGPASPDAVEHSAPIYVIDKQGNVRLLLPTDFQADDLIKDLRALLAES